MVKINTKQIDGCKVLNKIPSYLTEKSIAGVIRGSELQICDMGTLGNFKRFMNKNTGIEEHSFKQSEIYREKNWAGTKTWDEYLDILETGDEKVMKQIKVATDLQVAELSKKYEETIINYKFDVTGQFFDVGLVLTGVPESWLEPESEIEEKVKVDLVLNGAFNAGFNQKKIVSASARILAMTKILEDNGVLVSIKLVSLNVEFDENYKKSLLAISHLKDYDEPLNYKKMSALLSPTFHRRGLFKIMEMAENGKLNSGYGTPRPFEGVIQLNDDRALDKLEHKLFKGGKK